MAPYGGCDSAELATTDEGPAAKRNQKPLEQSWRPERVKHDRIIATGSNTV